MYNLLNINGVELPEPKGSFSLAKRDVYNEYTGEDGSKTIEEIVCGKIEGSVAYNSLMQTQIARITAAITLVSECLVYDPATGHRVTISAKITGIKSNKIYHANNLSAWSLSFTVTEL